LSVNTYFGKDFLAATFVAGGLKAGENTAALLCGMEVPLGGANVQSVW
jgi:hypothetical protein